MSDIDPRGLLQAAANTALLPRAAPSQGARLSDIAQRIAAERVPTGYSPIVLAGTVRIIEFWLIILVGLVLRIAVGAVRGRSEW